MKTTSKLEHENLHRRFQYFGTKHLEFRQKCIGLLPRIFKEKIYEKKGCDSIFEYAAKFAGLSHEQVKRALSLHTKFEDKLLLKDLLESGEVSMNKLARVASIVTNENEEILANQVRLLSSRALETLVRDEKLSASFAKEQTDNKTLQAQDGLFETKNGENFVHVHKSIWSEQALELSEEVREKLFELKNKGLNINEVLMELLKHREDFISKQKDEIAQEIAKKCVVKSRYIPVKVKKIIQQEQGTKCSMPNCTKLAVQIHHTQRFALAGTHDPRFMANFCKEHHQIAHSIDVKFHEVRRMLG